MRADRRPPRAPGRRRSVAVEVTSAAGAARAFAPHRTTRPAARPRAGRGRSCRGVAVAAPLSRPRRTAGAAAGAEASSPPTSPAKGQSLAA